MLVALAADVTSAGEGRMNLVYVGSLDDSVVRNPWAGIRGNDFMEAVLRQTLTSDPMAINDGYIFQSKGDWALLDIQKREESFLFKLASAGFLKVLCRTKNLEEMPERMSGVVDTHTALVQRSDFSEIKKAAYWFGDALLQHNAFASWPTIDIGYGFYLSCVAAYRMVRDTKSTDELGLTGVPRAMVLSAFRDLIRMFHENPTSIRGNLESKVIPKVIAETACQARVANKFKAVMMGFANELYHLNFAALLSAESHPDHGFAGIAVETRHSPLFMGLVDRGVLPAVAGGDRREAVQLDVPTKIAADKIDATLAFVTPGTGAFDAKAAFLRGEGALFAGDPDADRERSNHARALNGAIYDSFYGRRDEALVHPVNRVLEFTREYSGPLLELTEKLLSFVDIELYTGPGMDDAVEYGLTSIDVAAPSVVRRVGMAASPYPKAKARRRGARRSSLMSVGLSPEPCRRYREASLGTYRNFASRFLIDASELAEAPSDG